MACWPARSLLCALALATATAEDAAGCGFAQWTCGDGNCIDLKFKCNGGRPDCSDGSDEVAALCDKTPSMRMRVGEQTAVRAEYIQEHQGLEFHLCGQTFCSNMLLNGRSANGTLAYAAYVECNERGYGCKVHKKNYPDGWDNFPAGPLVVKVHRRPSELAVWLDGHEDKVATVPVEEDGDLLRVRPHEWNADLRAQFNSGSNSSKGS